MSSACCNPEHCGAANCLQADNFRDTFLQHLRDALCLANWSSRGNGVQQVDVSEARMSIDSNITSCMKTRNPVVCGEGLLLQGNCENHQLFIFDGKSAAEMVHFVNILGIENYGVLTPYIYISGSQCRVVLELGKVNLCPDLPHPSCKFWFLLPLKVAIVFELMLYVLSMDRFTMKLFCLPGEKSITVQDVLDDNLGTIDTCIFSECGITPGLGFLGPFNLESIVNAIPTSIRDVRHLQVPCTLSCSGDYCNINPREADGVMEMSFETTAENDDGDISSCELSIKIESELVPSNEDSQESGVNIGEHAPKKTPVCQPCLKVGIRAKSKQSAKVKEVCTCVGHKLLQCPDCSVYVKGGEDRLQRLFRHVRESHKRKSKDLIRELQYRYPIRPCPSVPDNAFLDRRIKRAARCSKWD